VPIRPGTDAAFLLALGHVFVADGLVDLGPLEAKVAGVDQWRALVADFPPETVADWCGVPAATIRRLAHEFATTPRAALYGRIGLCNQEFGTLASWLVDVVNIVTGHFDTEGGLMWGTPVSAPLAWMNNTGVTGEPTFGRWHSRVRGAPEVLGQIPASCLAEEIATPGDLTKALLVRPIPLVRNFTENLMAYALGRRVEAYDQPTVRTVVRDAEKKNYRFSAFVMGVVNSKAFRSKRAEPVSADASQN